MSIKQNTIDNENQSNSTNLNFEAMNALRNKVQLIGNVGNDPEVKTLDNGKMIARLSIATNESYINDQGMRVTDTQWHNVIAWGKLAEIIDKFVVKGKEIAVEGKLVHRSYDDKNNEKRYITEININELLLLGK